MGLDIYHITPIRKTDNDNSLNYLSLNDLSNSLDYVEKHTNFIVEKDFEEYGIEKVIYFETKGYQRKGMRREFYTEFQNDGLYFDLKNVTKAFDFLKADHINNLAELQNNFRQNFIDNFVEGESIFCFNW